MHSLSFLASLAVLQLLLNYGICLAQTPAELEKEREEASALFSDADSAIENDPFEQGFRNMFSQSTGNEFVDVNNAVDVALEEIEATRKVMESADTDISGSFDANGLSIIPISEILTGNSTTKDDKNKKETRSLIEKRQRAPCMYTEAQKKPCLSAFREPTGRCTSLVRDRKTWGMATTPYTRVLPQDYEDGVGEMRTTGFSSRRKLLNARKISVLVTSTLIKLDQDGLNAQIMQWGQFISHEFTHLGELGHNLACCPDQIFKARHGSSQQPTAFQLELIREEIKRFRGHICIQIENDSDPIYRQHICMSQTRAKPASQHDCSPIGPRQQMNMATHVFDASNVYGSSLAEQRDLRTLSGGKMKTQRVGRHILPPQNLHRCGSDKLAVNRCPFKGGDSRINTTPNLIATHTVFLMKHNQIAESLGQLNRHWNDERIFLETRRIIAAIQSNIHFYEYLPIILNSRILHKYRLSSYAGFDEDENPSVLNEMAGAAMRFGHSTVDGQYLLVTDDGRFKRDDLISTFNNESSVYQRGPKEFIEGLLVDSPWTTDNQFPMQMRDMLFNQTRDIVALNINRGRDHGFQSYVNYRRHYGLSFPSTFEDMLSTHTQKIVDRLKKAYSTVNDIELYIGGVTETALPNSFVGELFANILGDGFSRLVRGDRFFFESSQSGLTPAQIQTIRSYKYHQLLCESTNIPRIVSNAFFSTKSKPEVECAQLTPLNLALWKEDPKESVTSPESTSRKPSPRPISTGRPSPRPTFTSCHWQITDMTNCCDKIGGEIGKRTTTRECVGGDNCQCSGPSTLTSLCTCHGEVCEADALRQRCERLWRRKGIKI